MHISYSIPVWKKAPFIRLLLPLIAGIIAEWYLQFQRPFILSCGLGFIIAYLLFYLLPASARFRLLLVQGFSLNLLLATLGMMITWQKDIRNDKDWYGRFYQQGDMIIATINEPPVEKPKSFKANCDVEAVVHNNIAMACKGKIILYFSKDSSATPTSGLHYGDRILLDKNLQAIKNSGNPCAFNYERYAAFQQIFQQAFLKEKEWVKLEKTDINHFNQFIFSTRDNILHALRKNISDSKDELGIAQALLIGYTNDLDKDLVQAYSNTGVVHIIAISGMHLALIYLLLVAIFKKIPGLRKSAALQVLLVLCCLWLFSLLTGASASVLRAAVMFSFIAVGTNLKKSASIYNSLAGSAFVLLCYNPYFLWDVGFQLSYLAVISIIIFQKPVFNIFTIANKWALKIWELVAVSLSAQILTFPVCIYYFHQFPNFFLLTNIIAVPLSSIILYAEIVLVIFSWLAYIGPLIGKTVAWMVWLMNQTVLWINKMPFAVWNGIPATVLSTWIMYGVVICTSTWLINKNNRLLRAALVCLLLFVVVSNYENWQIKKQQKMIVYNISQHSAIDFINGNNFSFIGDSAVLNDPMLQNYNLKPARTALQLYDNSPLKNMFRQKSFYQFNDKKILLIDAPLSFETPAQKANIDIIIISKNPALQIAQLASVFNCRQYIFDASNSLWKIDKWQKECEELHLRSYSVAEKGAFVLDVGE